jgi:hypothetical protein
MVIAGYQATSANNSNFGHVSGIASNQTLVIMLVVVQNML